MEKWWINHDKAVEFWCTPFLAQIMFKATRLLCYSSFFLFGHGHILAGYIPHTPGAWRNLSGDYQDVGRRGCQVGGFAVPARRRWPLGVQGTNRMRGWWRRDATQLNGILIWMWVKTLYPQWTSRLMVIPYTTWLVGFDPYPYFYELLRLSVLFWQAWKRQRR